MSTRSPNETKPDHELASLRRPFEPTIGHMVRSERIKLRAAAREAVEIIEGEATPTREYLDYMWNRHVGLKSLRTQMTRLRERITELEEIQADAGMEID